LKTNCVPEKNRNLISNDEKDRGALGIQCVKEIYGKLTEDISITLKEGWA